MEGSWQNNGQPFQGNGVPTQHQRRPRMPTVREALPYTPLSSIIPFSADFIPPPVALPTTPPSMFPTPDEAKSARDLLDNLSAGATNAETASKRCQQTLNDVQRLLDPGTLTQYQFKKRTPVLPLDGSKPAVQVPSLKLSPFARMVFDSNRIPFRYLTPETSPEPKLSSESLSKSLSKPSPMLLPLSNGTLPSAADIPMPAYTNGMAITPTSSQKRQMQAVVVSSNLTPSERTQYQHVSATQIKSDPPAMASSRGISISQQQKGDQASHNLQEILSQIFQAEDQMEPDTSGMISADAANFFVVEDIESDSAPALQPSVQSRLESHIHRAASHGRLGDLQVEHLSRVQRYCERPVAALETLSLHIGEDWSEDDVQEWLTRIRAAEAGLSAARTLIHIKTGVAQAKELHSEDHLRTILDGLKSVVEGFLVKVIQEPASSRERIRGEKAAPPPNPKFTVASEQRKEVLALLNAATKSLRLLGELLVKTELDETSISTVEYLCKTLIFVENASTDKDSPIGVQNFEALRRCAMDVLAKVFTKYTGQRQFIFDEVLISLEKLPATKQTARQYRFPDAKPIQLVSALLMRLVQTSATKSSDALRVRSRGEQSPEDEDDDEDEDEDEDASGEEDSEYESDEDDIKVSPSKPSGGSNSLSSLTKPLHDAAQNNANYIVHVLIQRAQSTSKSSEEPYRKLLDIFTEDFINCLGSPDWPAAELLLRVLTIRMIGLIEKESSNVPSRTLALEFLGIMGSGILELQITARNAAYALDVDDAQARSLQNMVKQLESGALDAREALSFHGPHRMVVEFIHARNTNDDAQLTTARGCHLMQWAQAICNNREGSIDSDASGSSGFFKDLQTTLKQMLTEPRWLDSNGELENLTAEAGKLAAMVVTLNSPFCKAFNKMFSILLTSMSSEHSTSTVKSRSLKSVVTLLEKDPALLERNSYVLNHILKCASDSSPLVRDSALSLIDKCMTLKPSLSATFCKTVILRTNDGATGVRKRAMKMLKDIYIRNSSNTIRSAIANAIIARIEDTEDSVVEIARVTMEEIWFHPLYSLKPDGEGAIKAKLAYSAHAALFIETVDRSDEIPKVLELLLKRLLTKSKTVDANARVCKTLISVLFDGIIDSNEIEGSPAQDGILRSLTILARACPSLFTPTQLERLEPYTQNLNDNDDLDVYRSVVIILRYALPHQAVVNETFLKNMHMSILKAITKLPKAELSEAVPCLWTISGMIDDTQRVAHVLIQLLTQISAMRKEEIAADQKGMKLVKLTRIVGELGNACDFAASLQTFRRQLPTLTGATVPDMIVEAICPFTSPKRPLIIREAALEALCSVAQAWPKMFLRKDVENSCEAVFRERSSSLETVLLRGLEDFFVAQESPEGDDDGPELGSGIATGHERLSKTYVASDQDGASISMAQRFINQILQISLTSCDEPAFVAARLVISINKQGLVHPKESVPALVALGTCPDKAVSAAAFKEHKSQHSKHESLYDKEYMRAIQRTFEYQSNIIGNAAGFLGSPPTAKLQLTWEVMKTAKAQVRKKFLANLAQRLDFKFNVTIEMGQHLRYVRFCLENMAFLEYDRVDDLLQVLTALEKVFAGTGSTVAQAIESEVLKIHVGTLQGLDISMPNGPSSQPMVVDVDTQRLQHLALSSQILTLVWETRSFLIRIWNMQRHMARSKQQNKDKDIAKAPNRSSAAASLSEGFLKTVAEVCKPLVNEDVCRAVCSTFVDLISVDSEVNVAAGEEGDDAEALMEGYDTPSEGSRKSPSLPPGGSGKGRKRKLSNAGQTPRKKGRTSGGEKRMSVSGRDDDDDEGGWD